MKLTNNMLRVISHAYATNEPIMFLNSVGLYNKTKDTDILQKAIAIASIINKLTSKITATSEKRFYAFEINAEKFEKEIAEERKGTNIATIKEILNAGGVVYEDCLDYMYIHLTKYEPNTELPEGFTKSLDATYNKLMLIAAQDKETLSEEEIKVSIETIKELNKINSKLTADLTSENKRIAELNSTVKAAKDKIEDMLLLEGTYVDIDLATENLETLFITLEESIREQRTAMLKHQVKTIVNKLKEKLEDIDTSNIESKATTDILSIIDILEKHVEDAASNKNYSKVIRKLNKLDDFISSKAVDRREEMEMIDITVEELGRTVQRASRR